MFDSNNLLSCACAVTQSRGRRFAQLPSPTRTEFQRDRDRIIHSTAFRRLEYKTQVFINHEGDLFRTRLTHSIEVAQIARSVARSLCLNEDLVEGIALAHDMGHTPFGHSGQDVLDEMMNDFGGFEHNWQSLRVVDYLEDRYPDYLGLNLTFEMREGILKHCSKNRALQIEQYQPNDVASRFLKGTSPSLEAQLTDLADCIAYNAHDVDDGLRSGLLTVEQMQQSPLFAIYLQQAMAGQSQLSQQHLIYDAIRRMITAMVYDLIDQTKANLAKLQPKTVDEVRSLPSYVVSFSAAMRQEVRQLKSFLMTNLYRHPQVHNKMIQAKQILRVLFNIYRENCEQLSPDFLVKAKNAQNKNNEVEFNRVVADYIAGMTDRFALNEYNRLTGRELTKEFYSSELATSNN